MAAKASSPAMSIGVIVQLSEQFVQITLYYRRTD